MSNIIPFDFKGQAVRVLEIETEPWFVAADLGRVLGLSNVRMAVAALDADEKGVSNAYTPSGEQRLQIVNESGLYHLIFKSRKPAARAFRKWVTAEVIPSIRRTGKYASAEGAMDPTPAADRSTIPAFLASKSPLTFDELVFFGARVRCVSQALGISYEHEIDEKLGRVRSYAMPVLISGWEQLERKRRLAGPVQMHLAFLDDVAA